LIHFCKRIKNMYDDCLIKKYLSGEVRQVYCPSYWMACRGLVVVLLTA